MQPLDYRRLRGVLAEHQISHTHFATVCGLSRAYLCHVLAGHRPGELATIKMHRGLVSLGLDQEQEAAHAS
jgi:hypothetical protein